MNDSSSIEAFHDRKKLEHFCWKMDFVIDLKDELSLETTRKNFEI